ncbi:MAG: methionine adenosyltransferase domain-containing protein [Alphaproteobacteria bacterium]|nr:methionine adenosyltransferase domain-containing protein [Alphaproteobacteria bacterium]
MLKTAEAVSIGHPDKTADYISSYLLDELLKQDPWVRYAVEVMVKDNTVIFAGEVSGKIEMPDLLSVAKGALADIGYTEEYSRVWQDDAMNPSKLRVLNLIGAQSTDISQGVNMDGWGDQGVFVGYACKGEDGLPPELYLARKLNAALYQQALEEEDVGLDIKTQITLDEVGKIDTAVVAIPMRAKVDVRPFVISVLGQEPKRLVINGTGAYKMHSAVADCGVTGRKLACDFYSTACPVGGGSPWGKDATKADVTLNHKARALAGELLKDNDECFVYLSSCIGKSELPSAEARYIKNGVVTKESIVVAETPKQMIEDLRLNTPVFKSLCRASVGLK